MKTFTKNTLVLSIAMGLIASGVTTTVFAQEKSVTSQSTTQASTGRLVQIGTPVASEPLKGFAKDLPLIAVLRQLTPNGWLVKKNENSGRTLQAQKLVSWEGGKSWVDTLGTVAATNGLDILVNWNKKEITVAEAMKVEVTRTVSPSKKEGLFELEASPKSVEIAKGNSQQSVGVFDTSSVKTETVKTETIKTETVRTEVKPEVKPEVKVEVKPVVKVEPVAVETWQIRSGSSLRDNVTDMAKRAGYKVVWTGDDYPADDDRVLTGSFDAENGPIKQLSVDYGPKSRVQQPLSFIFFQNKTLVVENWKFEQSGAAQYIHRAD